MGGKAPEPAEDDTEAGDDEDGGEERDEERELVERPPSGLLQRGQLPASPLTDVGDLPLEQNVKLGPEVDTHLLRGARHDWRDDWQCAVFVFALSRLSQAELIIIREVRLGTRTW